MMDNFLPQLLIALIVAGIGGLFAYAYNNPKTYGRLAYRAYICIASAYFLQMAWTIGFKMGARSASSEIERAGNLEAFDYSPLGWWPNLVLYAGVFMVALMFLHRLRD